MELIISNQDINFNKKLTINLSLRELIILTAGFKNSLSSKRNKIYESWDLQSIELEGPYAEIPHYLCYQMEKMLKAENVIPNDYD